MIKVIETLTREIQPRRHMERRARRRAREPRILLLTSGLGCGHARAADAVGAALQQHVPKAVVRRLDLWSLMNPGVADAIKQTYLQLVEQHPDLYERVHRLDQHTWRGIIENDVEPPDEVIELFEIILDNRVVADWLHSALGPYPSDLLLYPTACATLPGSAPLGLRNFALPRKALAKLVWSTLRRRMEQHIVEFEPDVAISTQMVPAALVSAVKLDRGVQLPSIAVLTDFGVHDYWVQPGTDLYCVPDESVIGSPLPVERRERIAVTGMPLMPGFASPPSPAESRAMLGLDVEPPVALVLGGGLGLGVDAVARRLLDALPGLQLLVMTGSNSAARDALAALATHQDPRLTVCGWTDRMETFLSAADIVVGKPGGLTVAETLACGRPLLATRSLRGQEGFNVDFLERKGVGRLVAEDELTTQVRTWLADRATLAAIQARAAEVGRRNGASDIARRAVELAREGRGRHVAGTNDRPDA